MPNRLLPAILLPLSALHAAVIRGTVADLQTGKMLARAVVSLQPVSGTPGQPHTFRTNRYGQFEFDSLAAGAYLIKASRRGFLTTEYGQKQWNSAGMPLTVAADAAPFITLRLPRFSGITGTVVDENDVGMPEMEVLAYRATQPPELVTRATSDDRGVFRLPGLLPGNYLVRTASTRAEYLEYLPTFGKETLRVDEAKQVTVTLDDDARNADVSPVPGRLYTLSGRVTPATLPIGPVTVTLASDMGRQTAKGLVFQFQGLAPGPYELFAEAPEDPAAGTLFQSGYTRVTVGGDSGSQILMSSNQTQFDSTPKAADKTPVRIMARRIDLAGPGPAASLILRNNRAALSLGRWEIMILPPPGQYVSSFSSQPQPATPRGRPDGWNEIETRAFTFVRYTLSGGPGAVHGVVKHGGEPVPGAPVYLEAYDPAYRKRLMDLQSVRTDMRGTYRFENLAPGTYRLLATFEYQNPDAASMEMAGAHPVRVEAKGDAGADLALYELR